MKPIALGVKGQASRSYEPEDRCGGMILNPLGLPFCNTVGQTSFLGSCPTSLEQFAINNNNNNNSEFM